MKNVLMFILLATITSCATVKEKTGGLKGMTDTCPPKEERTLKNIICKEPK